MKARKLSLKKEVIAQISNEEMEHLKGGSDWFCGGSGGTCAQMSCGCPTPYPGGGGGGGHTRPPRCCQYGCCETIGC